MKKELTIMERVDRYNTYRSKSKSNVVYILFVFAILLLQIAILLIGTLLIDKLLR